MRRLLAALAAVLVVGCVGAARPAAAQSTAGERIRGYDVDITVLADGDIQVIESIQYDFAGNQRHGIFRTIPVRARYDDTHDRLYPVHNVSVLSGPPGSSGFVVEEDGASTVIRIGDPDRTITGPHVYTFAYRVKGTLNGFAHHVELYWNAVGAEWEVPIERTSVRVRAPAAIGRVACFAGPAESSLPCRAASATGDVATFAHDALDPYEAMTVVVAMPLGSVPPPAPILRERWTLERAFTLSPMRVAATLALLVLVVVEITRLLWRRGRDLRWAGSPVDAVYGNATEHQERVPLLEDDLRPVELLPPAGVRPGQVGVLLDEQAHPLDITATIVDLAVRGYVRIEEIPKKGWFGKPDWRLVKIEPEDDPDLLRYERLLYGNLFDSRDEVALSSLKNNFHTEMAVVRDALYDDAVEQGWFPARPDRMRARWRAIGIGAVALSGVIVYLAARYTTMAIIPLPLVLGSLALFLGARWMPHRTAEGTAAVRRVQGFRRFIEESERDRARFAEQAHLFSEYLPYAVVFGATEKWARTFKGLDTRAAASSWYVGEHSYSTGDMGEAVEGFSVTSAGTLASTPGSSGGSGFGGSAGGGGGGGGGGSW